ncbi:MAG: chemotaxis protein CheW [Halanaerobiales bacterium]
MTPTAQKSEVKDKVIEYDKVLQDEVTSEEQYLTFQIASEDYGIELIQSKEVIKVPQITNVPHTEDYVLGVINLRGQIVPVIDLKKKLALEMETDKEKINREAKRIIIVQKEETLVGIMVDQIKEVLNIDVDNIQEITESERGISKEFIEGIFNTGDHLIIIIDINEILFKDKENEGKEQ